jgi:hypothetical protein
MTMYAVEFVTILLVELCCLDVVSGIAIQTGASTRELPPSGVASPALISELVLDHYKKLR